MPATTIHTPPKRPIAVSSLKWQPLDIAVGATLGAACGVIFWGFSFAYMPISSVFGAILPGFASIVHAVWYFSGTLAVLILRKPGAALYVNLIGTLVETVIGSQFDLGFVIISALLQGVFAEISVRLDPLPHVQSADFHCIRCVGRLGIRHISDAVSLRGCVIRQPAWHCAHDFRGHRRRAYQRRDGLVSDAGHRQNRCARPPRIRPRTHRATRLTLFARHSPGNVALIEGGFGHASATIPGKWR